MNQLKVSCFISYSRGDIDRDALDYFRYILNEESNGDYNILIDEDLGYGSNIKEFMDKLKIVNAVILLFSPSYKRKILERKDFGVYDEYKIIMDRYEKIQESKRQGKEGVQEFDLFPILFSGTKEQSIPEEIQCLKYADLVGFRVIKDSKDGFQLSDFIRKKYLPEISRIISHLRVIATLKNQSFEKLYKKYFDPCFLNLKAEYSNYAHMEQLFVKTNCYRKVESQAVYFIIGRKGSGKTTITDVMAIRHNSKYLKRISIMADKFDLESIFSLFNNKKIRSDTKNVFPIQRCFSFAWEAFLLICCMNTLVKIPKENLTDNQIEHLKCIEEFIYKTHGICRDICDESNMYAYFTCSFNHIETFIEECIRHSRSEEKYFRSDLQLYFQRNRFLESFFGKQVLNSFYLIVETVREKFLLTLDGFDSAFDNFRRISILKKNNLKRKAIFEVEWLRAFLQLVLKIAQKNRYEILQKKMDFCITVPHDRFIEILKSERDSYIYYNRYKKLKWSGIELAILLRKRLEHLTQTTIEKELRPEDRLNNVLKKHFKYIPIDVNLNFNGKQYIMPLFMYVLRHTFWRPRDVLLYYARIISVCKSLKDRTQEVNTEILRRIIKDVTREIINSEFINEFSSTITNIEDIISIFARQPQVLSYDTLTIILAKINFDFALGTKDWGSIEDKIKLLYEIGFLGVYADKQMIQRIPLKMEHCFYFNEGEEPIRLIGGKGFEGYNFIIHPVFCEYLMLDTSKNELILQFSWRYLHETEAFLFE